MKERTTDDGGRSQMLREINRAREVSSGREERRKRRARSYEQEIKGQEGVRGGGETE